MTRPTAMADVIANASDPPVGSCAAGLAAMELLGQFVATAITPDGAARLRAQVAASNVRMDQMEAWQYRMQTTILPSLGWPIRIPPARKAYAMADPNTRIVTTQDMAPLMYALVAGLIYGLIGAAEGAAASLAIVQAAGGDIGAGTILIGALLGGLGSFAKRALEGLRDQARAQTVAVGTPTPPAGT